MPDQDQAGQDEKDYDQGARGDGPQREEEAGDKPVARAGVTHLPLGLG